MSVWGPVIVKLLYQLLPCCGACFIVIMYIIGITILTFIYKIIERIMYMYVHSNTIQSSFKIKKSIDRYTSKACTHAIAYCSVIKRNIDAFYRMNELENFRVRNSVPTRGMQCIITFK